jgi:hypothetical protein
VAVRIQIRIASLFRLWQVTLRMILKYARSRGVAQAGLLVGFVLLTDPLLAANPSWLGRPFVKVLAQGDPIPGATGEVFNEIERFTLRDGKVHIVAGESANKKGLFRWQNGALTKLVYTDTLAPTGSTFDTVHFTTDETEGALNFSGEVFFGKPGAVSGFFELRDGVIKTVFDGTREVDGKTPLGLGYPVRVGHEVVGGTIFFEGGAMKNGILRWDGTHLRTVVQSDDDLPGSLGGFTGQPGRYQIAFDGENVGFVASADPQGKGPFGMYRTDSNGALIKLIDGNDKHPAQNGSKTYFQRNAKFVGVDLDGTNSFLGVYEMVSAAGNGNSFYVPGVRYTDGTINVDTATFGENGTVEFLLPYLNGVPPQLDGKTVTSTTLIDGHGDDVALMVTLDDGTKAIYAAIAATTPPVVPLVLGVPTLSNGSVRFRFPSIAGKTYQVAFKTTLGDSEWQLRGDALSGTGADLEFAETAGATGFYRVNVFP